MKRQLLPLANSILIALSLGLSVAATTQATGPGPGGGLPIYFQCEDQIGNLPPDVRPIH